MRLAFGLLSQESNTFNPIPTELENFRTFGYHLGSSVLEHADGSPHVAGFLHGVEEGCHAAELIPLVSANAVAGGRLSRPALERMTEDLLRELSAAQPIDGLALLLHGACTADGEDDVDGHLLAQVRTIVGPDIPIVVGLDHHANITGRMVEHATAIIGHRTQPHDTFGTSALVADLLIRVVDGASRPTMSWRKLPLISHAERFLTAEPPMALLFERAREMEQWAGVLHASPFPVQPWLDVEELGWSVVVVTDGDRGLAKRCTDELAELAWSLREDFQIMDSLLPSAALDAAASRSGLTVICDTGDSVRAGAAGDSPLLLAEVLRRGGPRTLLTIVDPAAVARAIDGRVGDEIEVEVGGALTGMFPSVSLRGVIRSIADPILRPDDGFPLGEVLAGPTVVLDTDGATVLLTTVAGVAGNHPIQYTQIGVDPSQYEAVVIKTATNSQHFRHLSTDVIRARTPGPSQTDLAALPWRRSPALYPFDQGLGVTASRCEVDRASREGP